MKSKITLILLLCLSCVLSAQTVSIQGGSSYGTIQEAIDAATNGDVILIDGTHTISAQLAIPDVSFTLRGSDPTEDIIQAGATPGSGAERVISLYQPVSQAVTFNIENLSIKNGNSTTSGITRGGGIYIDGNYNGVVNITNCIVEGNVGAEGGGIASLGTNLNITDCTIKGNTGTNGGGILATANDNNSGMLIDIKKSLISDNTSNNGGGIYINGNNGSTSEIYVNVENSTIIDNEATSGVNGAGGGAIWGKARNNNANIEVQLLHATIYNNTHTSDAKNGLSFTGGGSAFSRLGIYNSIVVSAEDITQKAINWIKLKPVIIVNSILGGSNSAGANVDGVNANTFLDDSAQNNQKGRTASQAGLATTLSDEGGPTLVVAITASSAADDFCSAATGITIPTTDQRGAMREGVNDAGAYEVEGVLSVNDISNRLDVKIFPNPARSTVNISGVDQIEKITIYSVLGSVERVIYNQSSFDVLGLSSGMHLMVIKSSEGQVSKRLLVQ